MSITSRKLAEAVLKLGLKSPLYFKDYHLRDKLCFSNVIYIYIYIYSQSTLEDLMKQFDRAVDSHQDLWDSLGEIDKNTWVLEPEKPVAFSSTFRRIALGLFSFICRK